MTIQEQINIECAVITAAKNYLRDTDYLTIREYEGGEPMPAEIKTRRAEERAKINQSQAIIDELETRKAQEAAELLNRPEPNEPTGEEA